MRRSVQAGDVFHGADYPIEVGPHSRKDSIRPGLILTQNGGPVLWAKDFKPQAPSLTAIGKRIEDATVKAQALVKALREAKQR